MSSEELAAVIETVLEMPRNVPGRADTIQKAAEAYARTMAAAGGGKS